MPGDEQVRAASFRAATAAGRERNLSAASPSRYHSFSRASAQRASLAALGSPNSSISRAAIASRMASSIEAACSLRRRKASRKRWRMEETATRTRRGRRPRRAGTDGRRRRHVLDDSSPRMRVHWCAARSEKAGRRASGRAGWRWRPTDRRSGRGSGRSGRRDRGRSVDLVCRVDVDAAHQLDELAPSQPDNGSGSCRSCRQRGEAACLTFAYFRYAKVSILRQVRQETLISRV